MTLLTTLIAVLLTAYKLGAMDVCTNSQASESETVYRLSAFDELPFPIAATHIFVHLLDVSNPNNFLQSIKYWNRFNMVDGKTLAHALQLCFEEKKNITFEIATNKAAKTILHHLCFSKGNAAIINIVILAAGQDAWRLISLFNHFGRLAIHYAIEQGDVEAVLVFLEWAEENNKTRELIFLKNPNRGFDAFEVAKVYDQRAVTKILEHAIRNAHV